MASVVDICNLALTHIGHRTEVTSITPPDGSQAAADCNRFYPIARDIVLEMGEWGFAKKRVVLASLGDAPEGWEYRYALPSSVIKPLRVYPAGTDPLTKPEGDAFEIESDDEGTVILTNTEDAELQYIARVTDTTKYTPTATEAIAWRLAAYLAGPIAQDLKLAEYCEARAEQMAGKAEAAHRNSTKTAHKAAISRKYPVGNPRRSQLTDAE